MDIVPATNDERLREIVETAAKHHIAVIAAGQSMLSEAILCGEALEDAIALVPVGQVSRWIESQREALGFSTAMAYLYIFSFRHRDALTSDGVSSINGMMKWRRENPDVWSSRRNRAWTPLDAARADQARDLLASGMSLRAIGRELSASHGLVRYWLDPEEARRKASATGFGNSPKASTGSAVTATRSPNERSPRRR